MHRLSLSTLATTAAALALTACGVPEPGELYASALSRITDPQVSAEEAQALSEGNADFSYAFYGALPGADHNRFYSPYSLSQALAMTWGGARGATESAIAQAMRFRLVQDRLHPAFNALDLELASRGQGARSADGGAFRLNVVNAAFGQAGAHFETAYLDLLGQHYGAAMRGLDFAAAPDAARQKINEWVEGKTEGKIQDLLPEGSIQSDTVLVLTNAIYFNAAWKFSFEARDTRPGDFHLLDGSTRSAQMMKLQKSLRHGAGDGYRSVELPYDAAGLSLLVIMPDAGRFEEVEAGLDRPFVAEVVAGLQEELVGLVFPKFNFKYSVSAKEILAALGMELAFSDSADLSGINGMGGLKIADVVHQALVQVNEAGTVAAAASAVIVGPTAVPGQIVVDRPFLFLIRDQATGAILFLGRLVEPVL